MHTAPTRAAPGQMPRRKDRWRWPLAVTGVALLVASVVMMVAGA